MEQEKFILSTYYGPITIHANGRKDICVQLGEGYSVNGIDYKGYAHLKLQDGQSIWCFSNTYIRRVVDSGLPKWNPIPTDNAYAKMRTSIHTNVMSWLDKNPNALVQAEICSLENEIVSCKEKILDLEKDILAKHNEIGALSMQLTQLRKVINA